MSDSWKQHTSTPNPFHLTKDEIQLLDPNFKKPIKKISIFGTQKDDQEGPAPKTINQTRLFNMPTISSKLKQRVSDNIDELWNELENFGPQGAAGGNLEDFEDEEEEEADGDGGSGDARTRGDPTFELASARRNIAGTESLSKFVQNSRKMFMLQYSLSVKRNERHRLEKELRSEEQILQRTESELRLAEQAFDQFLQENDRNAVAAMKKAEFETSIRMEKAIKLKQVDNRILTLKRDINKLKDSLAEYGTYQGFLYSLSPESWRLLQEEFVEDKKETEDENGVFDSSKGEEMDVFDDDEGVSQTMEKHLGMSLEEIDKAKGEVKLYFQDPLELLSIFSDLEDENLALIQECREAESNLERIRTTTRDTHSRLNQQASNFQSEISKLEKRLAQEYKAARELRKIQAERANEGDTAADARRSADDKILKELAKQVRGIFIECVGEVEPEISTMELLKRIELRMEKLTQELESLPIEKIKIAQRTCERERRHRENEAMIARHRQFEEEKNRRALERALAPPFVKPELRKFLRKSLTRRNRKTKREKGSRSPSPTNDGFYP